jgi:hypothetical protein
MSVRYTEGGFWDPNKKVDAAFPAPSTPGCGHTTPKGYCENCREATPGATDPADGSYSVHEAITRQLSQEKPGSLAASAATRILVAIADAGFSISRVSPDSRPSRPAEGTEAEQGFALTPKESVLALKLCEAAEADIASPSKETFAALKDAMVSMEKALEEHDKPVPAEPQGAREAVERGILLLKGLLPTIQNAILEEIVCQILAAAAPGPEERGPHAG